MALTFSAVQPLLAQFQGEGLMVSCYFSHLIVPGKAARWPGPLKARWTAIKDLLADDPPAWEEFERNFQAIGKAVESPEVRSARGMAVFAALQRGFVCSFPLDVPVENELVVHESPYLVPLLEALCRQREYLVVHTDTHRGRVYAAAAGRLRLLEEIDEEVPSRQHSTGDRWGKAQATIARRREDRILHYRKDLVQLIETAWAGQPFAGIVLMGEHEVVEHLRKELPPRLGDRVVAEKPHAWADNPLATAAAVAAALAEIGQAEEGLVETQLEERLREQHGVAAGPRAVLEALQSGQMGARGFGYLVLGPDPREQIARCTGCRSLFFDMPATCPRCQAACTDASLWEEVLLLALRHNIAVRCLKTSAVLAGAGGMAAVLGKAKEITQ